MKHKQIAMRKPSGFHYTIDFSVLNTPEGKMRNLVITDNEVLMNDKPLDMPGNQMTILCNDMDLDTNKKQLRELCRFILKELK